MAAARAVVFISANAPNVGILTFNWLDDSGCQCDRLETAVVNYLANATGWSDTFGGLPTVRLDGPPQFATTADGWSFVSDQAQYTLVTGYVGFNNVVTIPSNINGLPVTGIAPYAFMGNSGLTSVTIGNGVTSIGDYAFAYCGKLTSVYFGGNAPAADSSGFDSPTIYYLPGTLGWVDFSANTGLPTALWYLPNPLILNQGPGFGVQSGQFSFTISWATNATIVVEACTNLSNPVWLPVSTNTLINGTSYFSDPQPANLPGRFYRLKQLMP
jgi:BspA type Leucine rich repeat region (6 copies)